MEVRVTADAGRTVVHPVGAINSATADSFRQALLAAVDGSPAPVEIDLDEVPYVSSAALRALAIAIDRLKSRNQRLQLSNVSPSVYKILDISNFVLLLDVLG